MEKHSKMQKKIATADTLSEYYIHKKITVSELLKAIQDNPHSIMTNFDVRFGVEVLQRQAKQGSPEKSKIAREILKKAGLKAFIPKGAGHPKSRNIIMRYLRNNKKFRFMLYEEIDKTEKTVRLISYKYPPAQVGNAVREIVEELYEFSLKEPAIKEIIKGERSAHATNLVLSIEAWAMGVSYSPIHKFYYSSKTVEERREYFEQKDDKGIHRVEDSKLEIKRLPRKPVNVVNDYASAINIYEYAYEFYKIRHSIFFPFLCNDKDRRKYLKRVPRKHILHELPD
jgi:hypothetical protein